MIYQTYKPKHPLLKSIIRTFWYIEHPNNSFTDVDPRMVPDGCYHMVFNLAVPHEYMDRNGRIYRPALSHINAKQTDALQIRRYGEVKIMGAIFQPYGLYAFLRTPASEIAGFVWDVEQLLGSMAREIEERLVSAPQIADKFTILEQLFASYMQHEIHLNPAVVFACSRMIETRGLLSISELTSSLQISERSLERHFKTCIGITPKQFADIQRMQYILTFIILFIPSTGNNNTTLVYISVEVDRNEAKHMAKPCFSCIRHRNRLFSDYRHRRPAYVWQCGGTVV